MVDDTARAFDRAEWHVDAAEAAGQPRTRAFVHAELYRLWLQRRDLLAGDREASSTLSADELTTEGRAFTDAYYGRYLDDYGVVFADRGVYGVTRDEDAFDEIARIIDQRYAEWVYAGRPELPPEDEPGDQLASMLDDADLPPELTEEAVRSMSADEIVVALERLVARGRRSIPYAGIGGSGDSTVAERAEEILTDEWGDPRDR